MKLTLEFKKEVIQKFIDQVSNDFEVLTNSAKTAYMAATHEESRAEDQHDTFAIEASYLAAGQATRSAELSRSLVEFREHLNSIKPMNEVNLGSLFVLETDRKKSISFFSKSAGGTKVEVDGVSVGIITPTSPVGELVLGLKIGDEFESESKSGTKTHKILEIL